MILIERFASWEELLAGRVFTRHSFRTSYLIPSFKRLGRQQTTRLSMDLLEHWAVDADHLHLLAHHCRPLPGSRAEPATSTWERILHTGLARALDGMHEHWSRFGASSSELGKVTWVWAALEGHHIFASDAITALCPGWRLMSFDEIANQTSMPYIAIDHRHGAQSLFHNHKCKEWAAEALPGMVPASVPQHGGESNPPCRSHALHLCRGASNQWAVECGSGATLVYLWLADQLLYQSDRGGQS